MVLLLQARDSSCFSFVVGLVFVRTGGRRRVVRARVDRGKSEVARVGGGR